MSVTNVMAIHLIVVEIFQSEPQGRTDQPTLPIQVFSALVFSVKIYYLNAV